MKRTPTTASWTAAFSLIELLVVVAIISILAAIAIPNYLEAQTRAKVARAKADMRTLETAVAAYHVDYDDFPPRNANIADSQLGISASATAIYPCYQNRHKQLSLLTTPTTYIDDIPVDVFQKLITSPNNTFDYLDSFGTSRLIEEARNINVIDERGFVLISVGPDGVFGHRTPSYGAVLCPEPYITLDPALGSYKDFYDPTNGVKSYGNIYRFSGWSDSPGTLDGTFNDDTN